MTFYLGPRFPVTILYKQAKELFNEKNEEYQNLIVDIYNGKYIEGYDPIGKAALDKKSFIRAVEESLVSKAVKDAINETGIDYKALQENYKNERKKTYLPADSSVQNMAELGTIQYFSTLKNPDELGVATMQILINKGTGQYGTKRALFKFLDEKADLIDSAKEFGKAAEYSESLELYKALARTDDFRELEETIVWNTPIERFPPRS